MTQPDGVGTFAYDYDALGQLTTVTAPSPGVGRTYRYDHLGRMTSRGGGAAAWSTTYTDGFSCTVGPEGDVREQLHDGRGRLARATFSAGTGSGVGLTEAAYTYGIGDEPYAVEESHATGQVSVAYTYDARQRLTGLTRGSELAPIWWTPGVMRPVPPGPQASQSQRG